MYKHTIMDANKTNLKQAIPFFGVDDIDASIRFYVDGLGFTMINKWIDDGKLRWCSLERGGVMLMLQEFLKEQHRSSRPEGLLGQGVSICVICEDAIDFYHEVSSRQIIAGEPFVGNNMWVTEILDPDGYKIIFESETDVPEETKYAEWKDKEKFR
jgi:lactoylglutathione lyase